jgi:tRNA nucleotidyltransferase (CCA-adding enzyme)
LLVEAVRRSGRALDPVEATLAAIALHERTLSFSGADTTARDVSAYGWLLGQGANLRVLNRYLYPVLKPAQRHLLGQIVERIGVEVIHGVDIGFALVRLARPVEQLVALSEEVFRLEGLGALFVLHVIGGQRVRLVGCSRTPVVDVGRTLAALGGSGAPAGGASVFETSDATGLLEQLQRVVRETTTQPLRVSDIMSSPVRTVTPEVRLGAMRDSLHAWRCTGVPVVSGGALVGVISRRDIERAEREGALDEPVARRMSRSVRTAPPSLPLERALEMMEGADIGRLPVVRDGALIGIVTRTDVLRVLYAGQSRGDAQQHDSAPPGSHGRERPTSDPSYGSGLLRRSRDGS